MGFPEILDTDREKAADPGGKTSHGGQQQGKPNRLKVHYLILPSFLVLTKSYPIIQYFLILNLPRKAGIAKSVQRTENQGKAKTLYLSFCIRCTLYAFNAWRLSPSPSRRNV
jgi:hypothetical protein